MLFGLCINMGATDREGIGLSQIPLAAKLGFDYVEIPLAQVMALEDGAFFEGPMRALSESGIACGCCNNFFPASIRLTGKAAEPERAVAYARRALKRAADLGAKRVVFGSSGARNVPDGFPIEEALRQLSALLRLLAPIAQRHGITLVIEPLNRIESNIINTLGEGLLLARDVNHPAVASLVDFFHASLSGDATASIHEAGGLLRHAHFARVLGRSMPVDEKEDAYARFFTALHAIGYDETISLEAYASGDFVESTARGLSLLRRMWEDARAR